MKTKALWAVLALMMVLFGCAKDQELYKKVDDLGERVTALEKAVKELNDITIPGMQSIVAAIQGNIYVTSVTPTADGYTITFSNQTTAVIKNGVDGSDGDKGEKGDTPNVGVTEIDGQFYWAVDGKPLVDSEGKKIPVYQALPQLRINDGKWQVSYDEGATWADVEVLGNPGGSTISIEDGDTTVTFFINGEPYEIQKETPFYLVFGSRKDLGVPQGEEYMFEYTVSGVTEGDELEVDILNCTEGWKARVVTLPEGDTPGYIGVTNEGNTTGKVFVYAANGRGKTDIKSLVFEEGVLKAEADVKAVVAAGGEVTISVTTNMDYELYVDKRQKWISVAPATKATHTDVYTLVCEPNETGAFRSAEVDVLNVQTGEAAEVYMILQYPSESVATDLASLEYVEDNTSVTLYGQTVLAASENSAVVSDGTGYLYVTGASVALPVGKVISVTGVKNTDENEDIRLELASFEVTGQTSTVEDPETTYYGLGQDQRPLYTSVSGTLSSEDGQYYITAPMGQEVALEAPTSNYGIAAYVDRTVTVYGYLTSVHVEEGAEVESYTMVVNNAVPVSFKENAAWALSYENDPTAEYPEIVTNTVSGSSVPYQLRLYTEEYYNQLGGTPEAAVLMICDDLQYNYWYYGLYGFTKDEVFSALAHADGQTGSNSFKKIDYGKYYVVAVGTNPDGTVTGDYKVQEIEKKEPVSVASYSDFLGKWLLGSEVLTVTEKVNGSTYNVTGIKNQDTYNVPAIEAEFVDGKFVIKEQTAGEWYNDYMEVDTDLYLSGLYVASNGRTYASYPFNSETPDVILTGYVLETGAPVTVVPGSCKSGAFVSMGISWVIREGENAGKGNTFTGTEIGSTMTPVQEASADYKAWLGNYVINTKSVKTGADTTYNVALVEGIPNETILLNGLGIDGMPLAYNETDNTCDIVFGAYSSNNSYTFYLSGITNDQYVCTGESGTGRIATLTKGADNVISVKSVVYKVSDERPEVYAMYWGTLGKNSAGSWYTFSDVDYVVNPATLTPASASSAPSKSVANPTAARTFKVDRTISMQNCTVAAKFNAPASRKLDPRVEKSGMAAAIKLVK